jgi:putative ABC transport system permease protein
MATFLQDLRYGVRQLLATPSFGLTALLTLALAIGANIAIFSVVHAVLLEPLPYTEPERLVAIFERDFSANAKAGAGSLPSGLLPMSAPNFYDYAAENKVFEDISGYGTGYAAILVGGHEPDKIWSAGALDRFFEILRVKPVLGRTFRPEEQQEGRNKVVILSDTLWQRWFGRSRDVLGKIIQFEGEPHTIIGVMPPGFEYPDDVLIWHPAAFQPDIAPRNMNFITVFGRLQPGISLEAAQSHMDGLAAALTAQYPKTNTERGIFLIRMHEHQVGEVRRPLVVLWGAVGLLLLLACSNVAGLLLARATARGREMAVRTAVGASRGRLVRQMLVESLLLSVAGGALGLLLAALGIRALKLLVGDNIPRLAEAAIDPRALGFALALSLGSGLLFGLVPALRSSRADLNQGLKADIDRSRLGLGGQGLRRVLTVAQVAIAMTLVVGAGLLVRSFTRLLNVDPGYRAENVLIAEFNLTEAQYPDQVATVGFFKELVARIGALPGVESVGTTFFLPMSGRSASVAFKIDDRPEDASATGKRNVAVIQTVTPGFLRTLGVPLLRGRELTDQDDWNAPPVVLIDQETADLYWPKEDPIGKRITFKVFFGSSGIADEVSREIVGVVGPIRAKGLDKQVDAHVYLPNYQSTWRWSALAIRTDRDAELLGAAVRKEVASLDPTLAVGQLETLEGLLRDSTAKLRMSTWLVGVLAVLALVLAAIGVFGVVAYSIDRRTRELAIRMAVGARRGNVLRLVVAEGVLLGLAGIFLGLCGALAVTRVLAGLLFEVRPLDPPTFAVVAAGLAAVMVLASYIPARRITRLVPTIALKTD